MPAALTILPTIHSFPVLTVNLGTTSRKFTSADIGKAVKLVAADSYDLCEAGDPIEGIVSSSLFSDTGATRGGLTPGGIYSPARNCYFEVVCAEQLAVNDRIVAAAQPALGTVLPSIGDGAVPAVPVQKAGASPTGQLARIVGFAGKTGAPGTVCIAEFL